MPVNEKLANRIREALADQKKVEEKKMFSGMCFMVNGKMCVCVNDEEMMCRIGPDHLDEALEREGARPMVHNGRTMKGFVFIKEESIKSQKDFNYWISLSLAFNKKAKASKRKQKMKA